MMSMIIIVTSIVCIICYFTLMHKIHLKLNGISFLIFIAAQSFKEMVLGEKKMSFALKIAIRHYFWMRKIFLHY